MSAIFKHQEKRNKLKKSQCFSTEIKQNTQTRKRRILMKQKCNYINHEISINMDKLQQLLKLIKSKQEQQSSLNRINETNQEEEESIWNSEDNQSLNRNGNRTENENYAGKSEDANQHQKTVKKQRKLKFKYSIYRQYQFDQFLLNDSNEIEVQKQAQETYANNSNSLNNDSQELLIDFGGLEFFNNINQSGDQDCLLLDNSRSQVNLNKKKSIINSDFYPSSQVQEISFQTRYNWIDKYLNHSLNDTVVKAIDSKNMSIEIIKFNQYKNLLQCKVILQDQNLKFVDTTNNLQSLKCLKKEINPQKNKKAQSKQLIQYFDLQYDQFIDHNDKVFIDFPHHNQCIKLLHPYQNQQVIRLRVSQKVNEVRILIKNQNQNTDEMQRIMIFKQISQNQNEQKYKIAWTRYEKVSFLEDIILEGSTNYLITNICNSPSSQLTLIVNQYDLSDIKLQKAEYDPWRSYNMLCSSFQECSKVFMSQNVYDDSKPIQYLRSNFLDYGLVLEIYQNIYTQKVVYLDEQDENRQEEDKQLLFSQIYTKNQNQNIYLPDQLVIKFYSVKQKPARLYFPKKSVLIGNKMAEYVTIHSTFK